MLADQLNIQFDSPSPSSSSGAIHCGNENALLPGLVKEANLVDSSTWLPLMLYGESGAGKSFVALTIANNWAKQNGEKSVVVTTAIDLARLFQPSKISAGIENLSGHYRDISLLVIDDIHHVIGKPNADVWITNVLDYRVTCNLPTIFTAPTVSKINRLSRSLGSRLIAGLPVLLSLPSSSTRADVVRAVGESLSLSLDSKQITSLVSRSEGLSITGIQNLVRSVASDQLLAVEDPTKNNMDEFPSNCIRVAARRFGVRVADLKSSSRRKNTVLARSIAMFLIREIASLSLVDTGRFFQNRDHTTVRHACQKIRKQLISDSSLQDAVRSICESLNQRVSSAWFVSVEERCA